MSVWPKALPDRASLAGSEGTLVSVLIRVEARFLESLLDALAQLSFPVNPEIFHDAALVSLFGDGRQRTETATAVEFPAYEDRIGEVCRALEAYGFPSNSVFVTTMLDAIHSERVTHAVPEGSALVAEYLVRRRGAEAIH